MYIYMYIYIASYMVISQNGWHFTLFSVLLLPHTGVANEIYEVSQH